MNDEPLTIAKRLGVALDHVGARWAVGGSVASSVHGVPRSTIDLDVIVALPPSKVAELAAALAPEFAADGAADQSPSTVFHDPTMTKVDLFPAIGRFERNQLDRSAEIEGVRVIAAEDSLLAKLRWYRLGGEISDRQWRDIAGLVAIAGARLDQAHLRAWAAELGVTDLLSRALAETSGGF